MSTEMMYLAWAALLTAALWIPYIIAQVASNGLLNAGNYTDPTARPVPLWGQRAFRAHINAVESFAPFAALILLIEISTSASEWTAIWAAVYFWSRLVHTVVFLAGVPYIRTPVFTLSFVAICGLFWGLMF